MKISKFCTIEYLEIFCNFVNIPEYLNLILTLIPTTYKYLYLWSDYYVQVWEKLLKEGEKNIMRKEYAGFH